MSVTLTINGKEQTAETGQTILELARANNIYIPTLCDYPGLPPHGSCRLCIVQVKGRSSTPTACTTQVEEGMVVETDSPLVKELRVELLRMLLAEHPGNCLFCPENEHCKECMVTLRKTSVTTGCRTCPADQQCELQDVVNSIGLKSVAYPARYRGLRVEKEDPFFDRDYNLCVLCSRCIRVCEALHFTNIPTYVMRGSETRVGTSFDKSHMDAGCSFCGACVDACPTGTLWDKTSRWDGKPDEEVHSTCPFCSLGCEVSLLTKKNGSQMIISSHPAHIGEPLCVKGRFGVTEMVNHPRRLKTVSHVIAGQSVHTSWEDVIQRTAARLSACEPGDFSMLVSADCSSEDLYIANKFSRQVMGSNAILNTAARYGNRLKTVQRLLQSSQAPQVLENADLVFCLGMDLQYFQSNLEVYLKNAVERGARVVTLNSREHVPGRFATLWLQPQSGEEASSLDAIARGAGEGKEQEVVNYLNEAKKPVLLVGNDFLVRMPDAVERLVLATGAAIVAIPAEANLYGAFQLGLGAVSQQTMPKVLYLVGSALPQSITPDTFIIYQNTHLPAQNFLEGILLPMAAFGEAEGSMVDQSGAIKHFSAAVMPAGDALPGWDILCKIGQAMGKLGFEFAGAAEITRVIDTGWRDWQSSGPVPAWLDAPEEHDYMGTPLSTWVAGLRQLKNTAREET